MLGVPKRRARYALRASEVYPLPGGTQGGTGTQQVELPEGQIAREVAEGIITGGIGLVLTVLFWPIALPLALLRRRATGPTELTLTKGRMVVVGIVGTVLGLLVGPMAGIQDFLMVLWSIVGLWCLVA